MGKTKRKKYTIRIIALMILFLLMASAGNINANVIKTANEQNSDFTIQIFGIKDIEDYVVQLTPEEENSLKELFDNFKIQLDNSNDREERIDLFKEMIISLDGLGLIPKGVTIEELQQLVTTELVKQKSTVSENFNCLIAGNTDVSRFFKSNELNGFITFGNTGMEAYSQTYASHGWVFTDGSNDVVKFDGKLYGTLGTHRTDRCYHIGSKGFKGIGITHGLIGESLFLDTKFLGTALDAQINQTETKTNSQIGKPNPKIVSHKLETIGYDDILIFTYLYLEILNDGSAPVPSLTVDIKIENLITGVEIWESYTTPHNPSEIKKVKGILVGGFLTPLIFKITVDPDNKIDEENEWDNTYRIPHIDSRKSSDSLKWPDYTIDYFEYCRISGKYTTKTSSDDYQIIVGSDTRSIIVAGWAVVSDFGDIPQVRFCIVRTDSIKAETFRGICTNGNIRGIGRHVEIGTYKPTDIKSIESKPSLNLVEILVNRPTIQ